MAIPEILGAADALGSLLMIGSTIPTLATNAAAITRIRRDWRHDDGPPREHGFAGCCCIAKD
jgi:hypothetical protein